MVGTSCASRRGALGAHDEEMSMMKITKKALLISVAAAALAVGGGLGVGLAAASGRQPAAPSTPGTQVVTRTVTAVVSDHVRVGHPEPAHSTEVTAPTSAPTDTGTRCSTCTSDRTHAATHDATHTATHDAAHAATHDGTHDATDDGHDGHGDDD